MKLATVIMAAGKGTRMKSDVAKVLHPVCGVPMVQHVIGQAKAVDSNPIILIVGHQADRVREATVDAGVKYVLQAEQLGTGHAVQQAADTLSGYDGHVLVLSGDVPLLTAATLQELIDAHMSADACVSMLTAHLEDPTGYGRVKRGDDGRVIGVVEHKDASEVEKAIQEINTGIYLFKSIDLFDALSHVKNDNAQGEYYLPDVIPLMLSAGKTVIAHQTKNFDETRGVNTVEQLKAAEAILEARAGNA